MRDSTLALTLLFSCVLHVGVVFVVPALFPASGAMPEDPVWVDLVELRDPSKDTAHVPGSPAPADAPALPAEEESVFIPPDAPGQAQDNMLFAEAPERAAPSAKDLIPSLRSLMGLQRAFDNPLRARRKAPGRVGFSDGSPFDPYLIEVKKAVQQNWSVSPDADLKEGTTIVRVTVDVKGALSSIDLVQSSGMILHDYEAIEAVKRTFPFRSPPRTLLDDKGFLSIRFSFHYFVESHALSSSG